MAGSSKHAKPNQRFPFSIYRRVHVNLGIGCKSGSNDYTSKVQYC